jgi:hypothetical protein
VGAMQRSPIHFRKHSQLPLDDAATLVEAVHVRLADEDGIPPSCRLRSGSCPVSCSNGCQEFRQEATYSDSEPAQAEQSSITRRRGLR